MNAAKEAGVALDILRSWGAMVLEDFKLRNASNQRASGTDADRAHAVIVTLTEVVQTQQQTIQGQQQDLVSLQATGSAVVVQLNRSEQLVQTLLVEQLGPISPRQSRGTKRPLEDEVASGRAEEQSMEMEEPAADVPIVTSAIDLIRENPTQPVFLDLLKMDVAELVMKVSTGNLDLKDKHCFGKRSKHRRKVELFVLTRRLWKL